MVLNREFLRRWRFWEGLVALLASGVASELWRMRVGGVVMKTCLSFPVRSEVRVAEVVVA